MRVWFTAALFAEFMDNGSAVTAWVEGPVAGLEGWLAAAVTVCGGWIGGAAIGVCLAKFFAEAAGPKVDLSQKPEATSNAAHARQIAAISQMFLRDCDGSASCTVIRVGT